MFEIFSASFFLSFTYYPMIIVICTRLYFNVSSLFCGKQWVQVCRSISWLSYLIWLLSREFILPTKKMCKLLLKCKEFLLHIWQISQTQDSTNNSLCLSCRTNKPNSMNYWYIFLCSCFDSSPSTSSRRLNHDALSSVESCGGLGSQIDDSL